MTAAPASLLGGLARSNLREQALTALRRAITTGELAPGTHLVETELSEKLQISRGTLREAMRQLQQEGLISAGARGRLAVRHLGASDVRDIFQVRAALEGLAARMLSEQDNRDAVVKKLEDAIQRMEDSSDGDLDERIEADLDFHQALCFLTGNPTLLHSWKSLEGSIRMSVMYAGVERALSNMSPHRHASIVEAIKTGDAVGATRAVEEHMQDTAQFLIGAGT
ncbi:GntR family transcriptional regulator [Arthrobacter sedimenti]|uniref:GntR family transcriptional regulator n=1 Tax=Arthrobacter sedimenti TaxID=2694931 RepID=UPI000B34F851|nr:GntR family transcriptional regulator [Arthrobacter sedimenti]OUM41785.1 GntR family transcriptional regulator [Arthrobacter agilis]